jgi:hypothetical protein
MYQVCISSWEIHEADVIGELQRIEADVGVVIFRMSSKPPCGRIKEITKHENRVFGRSRLA